MIIKLKNVSAGEFRKFLDFLYSEDNQIKQEHIPEELWDSGWVTGAHHDIFQAGSDPVKQVVMLMSVKPAMPNTMFSVTVSVAEWGQIRNVKNENKGFLLPDIFLLKMYKVLHLG